jgi:hypothetical protein
MVRTEVSRQGEKLKSDVVAIASELDTDINGTLAFSLYSIATYFKY